MPTSVPSNVILDLLGKSHWTGMSSGKAKAMRSRLDKARGERVGARRQLLEDLGSRTDLAPGPQYIHPEKSSSRLRREADDLTPSELVWLQRLPIDPTKITHDEAARLAAMYSSLSGMKAESSKQLVASIWLPVKAIHDQLAADDALARAKQPLPATPASAGSALEEALAAEHPDWPDAALGTVASDLITKALTRRDEEYQKRVAAAEATVAQLRTEAAERDVLARRTA